MRQCTSEEARVTSANPMRLALIGFGEVGQRFAADLRGSTSITAYDILPEKLAKAGALGVEAAASAAAACGDAAVVISAVTADAAEVVAEQARGYLRPGQIFFDVNSAAPSTKKRAAGHVEASGADYVEGAVMGAVRVPGIGVAILAGGPAAETASALLNGLGFNLTPVAAEHGKASAIKLCRSIVIKGLEALMVDCAAASARADVAREVYASLAQTFPSIDWPALADNMAERVATHGIRRSAEMREAAQMLAEMGLDPALADAVADAQARGARKG
jgi:3-hydroxyisobutyrate dehydrogenase-like beta-hydroxyacid dehydrogenase